MSNKQNDKWLEEQREQFDLCLKYDSYENLMEAYEIILEVQYQGFKKEAVELENKWDEHVKTQFPSLWKIHKANY